MEKGEIFHVTESGERIIPAFGDVYRAGYVKLWNELGGDGGRWGFAGEESVRVSYHLLASIARNETQPKFSSEEPSRWELNWALGRLADRVYKAETHGVFKSRSFAYCLSQFALTGKEWRDGEFRGQEPRHYTVSPDFLPDRGVKYETEAGIPLYNPIIGHKITPRFTLPRLSEILVRGYTEYVPYVKYVTGQGYDETYVKTAAFERGEMRTVCLGIVGTTATIIPRYEPDMVEDPLGLFPVPHFEKRDWLVIWDAKSVFFSNREEDVVLHVSRQSLGKALLLPEMESLSRLVDVGEEDYGYAYPPTYPHWLDLPGRHGPPWHPHTSS